MTLQLLQNSPVFAQLLAIFQQKSHGT
jgi:hypothetical protein